MLNVAILLIHVCLLRHKYSIMHVHTSSNVIDLLADYHGLFMTHIYRKSVECHQKCLLFIELLPFSLLS